MVEARLRIVREADFVPRLPQYGGEGFDDVDVVVY
jgi:hypothetical protein